MTTETNRSKARSLMERVLGCSADKNRYLRRLASNPNLAKLGCLPQNMEGIVNDQQPGFCHGLAFRMATYSDGSDHLFDRWEELLKGAINAEGWSKEYKHWNSPDDHWAKKWDRFYQFLWLLQCFEYFSQNGTNVSFPVSKNDPRPDLCVIQDDDSKLYVECYFYTKWWGREHFLEDILRVLDQNLIVKRTYNSPFIFGNSPMSKPSALVDALAILEENTTPTKLNALRAAAENASPQLVCEIGAFSIFLEGSGQYQPSHNAHGDPSKSWPVFEKEIIKAKQDSNGLSALRPNLVMVNGLGLDFQLSLDKQQQKSILPDTLDEIRIYTCGIDDKVMTCCPICLYGER